MTTSEETVNHQLLRTPGLLITGTDTDVGKTYITALIARELTSQGIHVGVYKPVCTGSSPQLVGRPGWRDIEELARAIGFVGPDAHICPQRFAAPLAPPVAAHREGKSVDADLLRSGAFWWEGHVDLLLVEGVGGLLSPLTKDESVADLARDLGYPLIVVSRLGLGTINHTLMTVEIALKRGLQVAGIILNETAPAQGGMAGASNPSEIAQRCSVPILAVVGYKQSVREKCEVKIDWMSLARRNIAEKNSTGPRGRE